MTTHESPSPSSRCPQCGAALPTDAPHGLCPRCLGAMNLGTDTLTDAEAAATPPAPTPEELAPHFAQLDILECLGRGGMGVVYKARQKSLNRLVALKLLAPERASDASFATRFTREAQALAALNHPHIVTIHDFGQAGGFYYLLMEFVDGVNLRQAMKAGRFTPEQALAIVPPICEALQYAHEHGIVHRDIKPENLLLDKEGRIMIADFGVAKMLDADGADAAVAESQPAGTPQYMAPEQKGHHPTDHRADIYSLGVVFYEMLTGELPADKLQPPSSRLRGMQIDVRLDEIVLRALEKTPERRYQTAADMRTQVETVLAPSGSAGEMRPPAPPLTAVMAWLALMDRGAYAESWDAAAGYFRRALTKEKWVSKGEEIRRPLGALLSREVASTEWSAANTRFEARFKASFDGLLAATETVTFTKEPNGEWKAIGYLIRPAGFGETRLCRQAIAGLGALLMALPVQVLSYTLWRSWAHTPLNLRNPALRWTGNSLGVLTGVALLACTFLGWVAIVKIRRSAGRLHGLGLAVFEGLFFPLLALDAALAWLWTNFTGPFSSSPMLILVVIFLDFWIIRSVWRAVKRPPSQAHSDSVETVPTAAKQPWSPWKWLASGCMSLLVLGFLAIVLRVFASVPKVIRGPVRMWNNANDLLASGVPESETEIRNGYSVEVIHEDNDLDYVLFYAGDFSATAYAGHRFPSPNGEWQDDGDVTLANQRRITYRRESSDPLRLLLDGQKFDLRAGRVFVLHDKGAVEQRQLAVSLATAKDPDALAGRIVGKTTASPTFGPTPESSPILAVKAYQGNIDVTLLALGTVSPPRDAQPPATVEQQDQPVTVLFTIPEDSVQTVVRKQRAGQTLTVEVSDRSQANILGTGTLVAISNQIDVTTGTLECKARVQPNAGALLYPNQSVNVRLFVETKSGVTLIPESALRSAPNGTIVHVLGTDGRATIRRVTAGVVDRKVMEITDGLSPGQIVVADPDEKLRDGVKLRYQLLPTPGAAEPATP